VLEKIVTLYIGDTNIRLMVTRGRRISKLADAPLDMNPADPSDKDKEAEIVAKIKQLFQANKVNAKKVVVGLSGLHCLSRPVVLPQLPRAMLDEAVVREAKRVLPVPLEQLYLSWQIIAGAEGKMKAFMVAIPRQIADNLLNILDQAGLKPYLIDIKPLAIARLVKEATAILIDVQSTEFDIVMMSDGVPQPIRTVPFPEEVLSLPDKLLLVKDELKRTIHFYNSNNPEKPITPEITMYVSGELVDEPELYESLADELGYRVLPLSSPLKCPKQLDPAHYLVNIGLTLKELPKEAGPLLPNLNSLPVPYQTKPISLTRIVVLPSAAVAVGLLVVLVMSLQNTAASIDSVSSKLDATNFILEQKQAQKKELEEGITVLTQRLADAEAARIVFTDALDSLGRQGDVINGDLETTVNKLVNGVELEGISHSGKDLNIRGKALSEAEVLEYARKLDASGRFSEVTVANIMRVNGGESEMEGEGGETEGVGGESEGVSFTLALKLKGTG
jgi:type IV pilus assembly protein PilM